MFWLCVTVELVGESVLPKHHLSPQYAVVKIVREKYLKTTAFETQEQFQAFLSELYVYLVDQMHVALNQVGRNPGTCPVSWVGRPGVQHHWGSGLEAASSEGRGTFAFRTAAGLSFCLLQLSHVGPKPHAQTGSIAFGSRCCKIQLVGCEAPPAAAAAAGSWGGWQGLCHLPPSQAELVSIWGMLLLATAASKRYCPLPVWYRHLGRLGAHRIAGLCPTPKGGWGSLLFQPTQP